MKKIILITLLLFAGFTSKAQKLYVEKTDDGYEQPIIDKLLADNFKVTFKKDSADYIIICTIVKTRMNRSSGSIAIVNNKNGKLLVKSKEATGQSAGWHGHFNPPSACMQDIADDYLTGLINSVAMIKKTHRRKE